MPDSQKYRMTTPAFLFLSLLAGMAACGILSSDDPPELEPGPRNYEWTVDTLHSPPGGFIYDIWGSSPDDVWAVAGGGINNLWHFDGKEWSDWAERVGPSFYSIFGFSQDNVWMGGNDGKLYHFDGTKWSLSFRYEVEGMRGAEIWSIWGNSDSDIYAAGTIYMTQEVMPQGFILYYNGKSWRELLVSEYGVQFQRVRIEKGNPIVLGTKFIEDNETSRSIIYTYKNNDLHEKYSDFNNNVLSMNYVGNDMYYIINRSIYVHDNNPHNEIYSVQNPNFGHQLYGRHQKDIFFRMNNGLAHYNGEGIQYMFNVTPPLLTVYFNAMLFEKEVFFIVLDFEEGINYIYHGKLNENEEE